MSRFVYPYGMIHESPVARHVGLSSSTEALLEMKSFNLSSKFKEFPSDFTQDSHR